MTPHYAVVNARLNHRFGFGLIACCASFESPIQANEQQALKRTRGSVEHQGMIYTLCTRVWRYNFAERAKEVCVKIVFLDRTGVSLSLCTSRSTYLRYLNL